MALEEYVNNFCKNEKIEDTEYKIVEAILSPIQLFCPKCGYVFDDEQTYEKNGFKTSDILMLDICCKSQYKNVEKVENKNVVFL